MAVKMVIGHKGIAEMQSADILSANFVALPLPGTGLKGLPTTKISF